MLKKKSCFNLLLLLSIAVTNLKPTNNILNLNNLSESSESLDNSSIFTNSNSLNIDASLEQYYNQLFSQSWNKRSFINYVKSQPFNSDYQICNLCELSKDLSKISNKSNPAKEELDIALKIINSENINSQKEILLDYIYTSSINSSFRNKLKENIKNLNLDETIEIFKLASDLAKISNRFKPYYREIQTALNIINDNRNLEYNDYIGILKTLIGESRITEDQIETLVDFVIGMSALEIKLMFDNYLSANLNIEDLYETFICKAPRAKMVKTNNKKIIATILNFYAKSNDLNLSNSVKDLIINELSAISTKEIEEIFDKAYRRSVRFNRNIDNIDLLYAFYRINPITQDNAIEVLVKEIAQVYPFDQNLVNNDTVNSKIINLFKGKNVLQIEAILKESNTKRINRNGNVINYSDIIVSFLGITEHTFNSLTHTEKQAILEYYLPTSHTINQEELKSIASAIKVTPGYMQKLIRFTKNYFGKENISFKDFCIGLYFHSEARKVELWTINTPDNQSFFEKLKSNLLNYFLEQYQHNLTDDFKERFLKDINITEMIQIQALANKSHELSCKANRNAIEEIDLQRAAKNLNINYSNSFILNGNDLKIYVKAEHKEDNIHRLQFIVKNQFAGDGGGLVSDGYHAIKNGAIIAEIIQILPKDRNHQLLKKLIDADLIANKFGNEDSVWREHIIKKRKRDLAKLFIYETLLYQIKGNYHISRGSYRPKGINEPLYCLPFCQGWLYFSPFANNTTDINDERTQICNTLYSLVESIVDYKADQLDNLAKDQHVVINSLELKNRLINNLTEVLNISSLEAKNKIEQYIPNINNLSFSINNQELKENSTNTSLDQNFIKPYMTGGTGIGRLKGEWLELKELEEILELEKTEINSVLNSNVSYPIIYGIFYSEDIENNDQLMFIKEQLQNKESKFIAIVPIYDDGNWLLCILNKQGETHQYILSNSIGNSLIIDHPKLLELIGFLENKFIKPSNLEDKQEDLLNGEVPFEAQCSNDDIPSLELIFNNDIPKEVKLYISTLKDPDFISNANKMIPSPLLLTGEPGVGKNTLVQHIAREINADIIYKNGADFTTKWQGSARANLHKTFEQAKNHAKRNDKRVIIFIDEIDGVARTVSSQTTDESQKGVIALQDLLNNCQNNKRVSVIAATNNFNMINDPIKSRFENIKIPLPCYESRIEIIKFYLKRKGLYNQNLFTMTIDEFVKMIATATKGFSGRDLVRMLNQASLTLHLKIPTKKIQWYTFGLQSANPKGIWSDRIGLWSKFKKSCCLITCIPQIAVACGGLLFSSEAENHIYWAYADKLKQKEIENNKKGIIQIGLEALPIALGCIDSSFSIYSSIKLIKKLNQI